MTKERNPERPMSRFIDRMLRPTSEKIKEATESIGVPCCVEPQQRASSRLQVLWSGHLFDYSGYAKANRELLFRVANTFQIEIAQGDLEKEPLMVDGHTAARLNVHKSIRVSNMAPFIRFYTPRDETHHKDRFRILYTMMETEKVHPEMIKLMNFHYEEVWVPTKWNQDVFRKGGLKTPCMVMPLGVNSSLFKPPLTPALRGKAPECLLLTTDQAGKREMPKGYLFCSLFHPTFRKGTDVLLRAFERAFASDPEAALVLVTTVHQAKIDPNLFDHLRAGPASGRARIYHRSGVLAEEELPLLYSAFDSYVSPSRGEGWDLPAMEAAACGLWLINSKCSSHTELFPGIWTGSYEPDGYEPYAGSGSICKWYEGMPFAHFAEGATKRLAGELLSAKKYADISRNRALQFSETVRNKYSWDIAAGNIVRRLLEIVGNKKEG